MQNEKTFDTGELTLSYYESGAGAPMVLLHGLTSNKLAWTPLLPALTSSWHVYAPDLRGHGKTGHAPDEQYHNADYARDVIAFLKAVGEPAVLMGHSLGAMVAIVTAWRYPAGVRALVLLDPPLLTFSESVQVSPQPAYWFSLVASVNQDNPSYDTVVARLRARMPDVPDQQINDMATSVASVAPGAAETALRDELWQDIDLPLALQQITCPILLIHADWDKGGAMRDQDVESFKSNSPSAAVVHIPGADHGLKIQEQPDIVLGHVNRFLESC